MTLQDAKELKSGDMIYCNKFINRGDKRPVRARVTSVKTWKRNPDRIEVRAKQGLYEYFSLFEDELENWETDEQAAINPDAELN